MENRVWRDLLIRGSERIVDGDVVVNGWIELAQGRLVCRNLCCLGLSIEDGGLLECEELLANFVEVDNSKSNTEVKANWVRARVVDLLQLGMEEVVNRGDVTADYCQHFGGDLNPSWDYVRGKQVVLARYFESHPDDEDAPVTFDVAGIRKALSLGQPAFGKLGPLLTLKAHEKAVTQERPMDGTVLDLMTWFRTHPGPQRATLSALHEWLPRLKSLPTEAKAQADKVIGRAIKSPKLREQRDGLLKTFAPSGTEPKTAPPKSRQNAPIVSRIIRSAKPAEYLRPRPDAWLDKFAEDTETIEVYSDPEIKELPARIADFTNLTRFSLRSRLSRIAPELGRCSALEALDLSSNKLESLPDQIGQLQSLQSLNVEWNPSLAKLPESICLLRTLRELSLGHTSIAELPADFGQLSELHYHSLHGCEKLLELPESFFDLPKLGSLYLHGTRFPGATLARIRKTFPDCEYWNFFGAS